MSAPRRLVVGLGNPDPEHAGTRHNIGWMVADVFAGGLGWQNDQKLSATTARKESVLIAKPTTYMNESGKAVQAIRQYYKIEPGNLLVISDDINLPFGELRFRTSGSAGGQKGLADIIQKLGTEDVPRLRIGVGEPPTGDATPHVLGRFSKEEQAQLPEIIQSAVTQIEEWVRSRDTESHDG